MAKTLGKKKH